MRDGTPSITLNAAVFGDGRGGLALVFLDEVGAEASTADAAARGYDYCGCLGVNGGDVAVQVEPGAAATATMVCAGVVFAGRLGPLVKQWQEQRNN